MAHAPAPPPTSAADLAGHVTPAATVPIQHVPVSPGKVALWLFLGTEVMFFTGLIGSYVVLRAGSPATAYSNLYPPGTDLGRLADAQGVVLASPGADPAKVAGVVREAAGLDQAGAEKRVAEAPGVVLAGVSGAVAEEVRGRLAAAGAAAEVEALRTRNWPAPYDDRTNPLNVNLTAVNTFVLICSSLTMALALSSIQRGDRRRLVLYLLGTVLIGSAFLGVQVYEYRQLLFGHHFPAGVSRTGHFTPDVSLFASCFFTMTGFHGAHVAAGVLLITVVLVGALLGRFDADHYGAVEVVGLYWHFVDLVWILLFTVVYLI